MARKTKEEALETRNAILDATVRVFAAKGAAIAHQVLAAMGITEEHSLHHLTRRLWSWREEGGTERFWSARLGALVQGTQGPLWTFITDRDEEPAA